MQDGPCQILPVGSSISEGSTYRFTGYVKVLQSVRWQPPQMVKANIRYLLNGELIIFILIVIESTFVINKYGFLR